MSRRRDDARGATATDKRPRPSAWARWRADLRLARRQVWRTRGSSALVVLLVALPVFALTGGVVFWKSNQPSPTQLVTLALGRTQAWIEIVGGPDSSRVQSIDEPQWYDLDYDDETGALTNPERPAPTSPDDVLPAGTKTIEVTYGGDTSVTTATGTAQVSVTTGAVWDPVFTGRYAVIDGRAPASSTEVMVTPGLLQRMGQKIGGSVVLPEAGVTLTITGTLRELDQSPDSDELFLPEPGDVLSHPGLTRWYTPDWQPDAATLATMNQAGFVSFARDLVLDPPAGARVVRDQQSEIWALLAYAAIAAAFSGYLVVLLAGAAFAVSARRQARALAVAASVGATKGHVFRIVLLQGAVLGLVGGLVGSALALGASAAARALFDDGVVGSIRAGWGWKAPWLLVAAILVFAVLVGLLAAIAPARAATRGDALAALRGSRRPAVLKPRRPLWGLGLMVLGVAATIVGALGLAALNSAREIDYTSPWRTLLLFAIVAGPLVFQVGIIVGGHWTLAMISRAFSRIGLGARVASRDAAANPSRVVPAFAAIAACVFVASFALSMTAMASAGSTRTYPWTGHLGSVLVGMDGDDSASDPDTYTDAARALLAPSQPSATAVVWQLAGTAVDPDTGEPTDPDAPVWTVAQSDAEAADCPECTGETAYIAGPQLDIVAPGDLETILGAPVPAADLAAFRGGGALWFGQDGYGDDHATLVQWSASDEHSYEQTPADSGAKPKALHEIPVRSVATPYPQADWSLYIATGTADKLGMALRPQTMFAAYDQMPSDAVIDALTADAENLRVGRNGRFGTYLERGPQPIDPVLWLITGATLVLVIGAGAICLGLARFERRPDDATLTAVGAGRGLRRSVNAWQAVIVVGMGTVVGTVASLIPAWGIAQTSSDYMRFGDDTPWIWLGIVALGLPAVVAAASWLVPPRTPDLTRRTAIA
ncbi:ABC transporter permease [Microbacterium protaetiae]|nr:ABC transporter permease [Microbacterium protaetiae]